MSTEPSPPGGGPGLDWRIAFVGPAGAGKGTAIRAIADASMRAPLASVGLPASAEEEVGLLDLGQGDRLVLCRLRAVADHDAGMDGVFEACRGIVLLIDDRRPDPLDDLDRHLAAIEHHLGPRRMPLVIGVTNAGVAHGRPLRKYEEHLLRRGVHCCDQLPPLFDLDVAAPTHLRVVLLALAALIEMAERFPGVDV